MLEQITNSKFGGGKVLCESVEDTQLDRDGILNSFQRGFVLLTKSNIYKNLYPKCSIK